MGVVCQILLQKTKEGIHRGGKPVTGVIKYVIDKDTEYKDITLSLIGKGYCSWRQSKTTYHGHDEYIDRKINILEKSEGVTIIVPAGSYEYPFEFILPKDTPPSFKDYHCKITYEIVLEFVKPTIINSTRKFDTELNVYGYVKQNLAYPIIFGAEKSLFNLFSMYPNIINLKVKLAKTILTPGENANISYTITNQSTVDVNCVRIELLNKTKYTADCDHTKMEKKIFKECTVVQRGCSSDSIVQGEAVVPTLAELYTIQHTKVLSKKYFIRVTLELPMPHRNAFAEVEVVIGEVDSGDDTPAPYYYEDDENVLGK